MTSFERPRRTRYGRFAAWGDSVLIGPRPRWVSVDDPGDHIVVERRRDHRWLVRDPSGDLVEMTGAQIRSGFRHALAVD